jgi:PhnB protein
MTRLGPLGARDTESVVVGPAQLAEDDPAVGFRPDARQGKNREQPTEGTHMTTKLNPYLGFRDNAREAMEFYHSVFGGQLDLTTFAELHASDDPAEADKIMHSMLVTDGGLTLMASDTPNRMDYTPGNNHSVSLSGEDEAELRGYWEKLSKDGTVTMPLGKATWGDSFGMCVDKFGITWLVNIAGAQQAGSAGMG